jgi:threonine dehydratase
MAAAGRMQQAVTVDDVIAAAERVRALARETPVLTSELFNRAAGVKAFFKCENMQRSGSFKIRGALNFLMQLRDEEKGRGVVTFSSGNHAQAVAIAAAHLGARATIVMPTDAPKAKLHATQAYGPEIIFFDRQRENREEIAARIARDTGSVVLPSFDHPWIIAGQGTVALELIRGLPDLDTIVVPLGGGGLLSGTLVTAKALKPGIHVYGVEPELADDWHQSLKHGERVEIRPPETIADGLRTTIPGKITFPIVRELIDGIELISEDEIKEAVRFLLTRMKILVEPSGAVAAAAVLSRKLPGRGKSTAIIVSGGNVDLDVLADICKGGD